MRGQTSIPVVYIPVLKKILLLASNWPEPASSAAGSRTLQLLDLFLEDGWQLTFMTAAELRPHSAPLPKEVDILPLTLNSSEMDDVFKNLDPDLVWFDRFMLEEQYGWRIAAVCPHAKRMLDTIDLHSLRDIRQKALHQNRKPQRSDWFSDVALRELASIYRSDLSLLISDAEERILTEELNIPKSLLHITPFLLSESEQKGDTTLPEFAKRKDFVTIGNFRHPPNADSVRFLYESIWPAIRSACPDAKLSIYGADLTAAIQTLHQPDKGFFLQGRAENAIEVLSHYRVCLAPLRFGAGLKGKLLDAMHAGTPSVTTSIGAEGMQGPFIWPGAVKDEPAAFVKAAIDLYQQESLWFSAQKQISPLLKGRFDKKTHGDKLLQRIHNLRETASASSIDQLTGALLRHHQHRSTEYMSRWIEAKNKNQVT